MTLIYLGNSMNWGVRSERTPRPGQSRMLGCDAVSVEASVAPEGWQSYRSISGMLSSASSSHWWVMRNSPITLTLILFNPGA
jgi:hypothetical protein